MKSISFNSPSPFKIGELSKMPVRSRHSLMDKHLEGVCVFLLLSLRLLLHLSFAKSILVVRMNPRT